MPSFLIPATYTLKRNYIVDAEDMSAAFDLVRSATPFSEYEEPEWDTVAIDENAARELTHEQAYGVRR